MNFKESKPIYLQIADRICDEILQGQYKAGERIPSVRSITCKGRTSSTTSVAWVISWLPRGATASLRFVRRSSSVMSFPSSSVS